VKGGLGKTSKKSKEGPFQRSVTERNPGGVFPSLKVGDRSRKNIETCWGGIWGGVESFLKKRFNLGKTVLGRFRGLKGTRWDQRGDVNCGMRIEIRCEKKTSGKMAQGGSYVGNKREGEKKRGEKNNWLWGKRNWGGIKEQADGRGNFQHIIGKKLNLKKRDAPVPGAKWGIECVMWL